MPRKPAGEKQAAPTPRETAVPRRSLVQVRFHDRGSTLAYYNDRFDLHPGDIVFVDGKLEGLRGRVESVNYNFKIKAADYKRVIAVADTEVHGQFFPVGSHFVTFDRGVLSAEQAASWYFAPPKEEDEYLTGSDDSFFSLDELQGMGVSPAIWQRGENYYLENRVVYLSLWDGKGSAIVEGTRPYGVEFRYEDGKISELVCSCFCSYHCKHEVAVMLELRGLLKEIQNRFSQQYDKSGYFAAADQPTLLRMALAGKDNRSITL